MAHVGQELALEPVRLMEPDVRLRELGNLQVQALVHRPQLVLAPLDLGEHGVESLRELLELITRLDLGANRQIATLDFLGGLPEPTDRLEYELGQDQVEDQGRQETGHDSRGDDVDAVGEQTALGVLARAVDNEDRHRRREAVLAEPRRRGLRPHRLTRVRDRMLIQCPGIAVDDLAVDGDGVGVLGDLGVLVEPLQRGGQEGIGILRGLDAVHREDRESPVGGLPGIDTEQFTERARRLGGDPNRTVSQPVLGQLPRCLELPLVDQPSTKDPGDAQRRSQDQEDREAKQQLALVGKADSSDHLKAVTTR